MRIRCAVNRVMGLLRAEEKPIAEPPRQSGPKDLLPGLGGGVRHAVDRHGLGRVVVDGKAAARVPIPWLADRSGVHEVAPALLEFDPGPVAERRPADHPAVLESEGAGKVAVAEETDLERVSVEAASRFP